MTQTTHTGPFPTMGDSGIPDSIVNMSGQRSPYTQTAPGVPGRSDGPDSSKGNAGATLIKDAQGPRCKPIPHIYEGNAAEATATLRNVRPVKSAAGVSDFWASRAESGNSAGQAGALP